MNKQEKNLLKKVKKASDIVLNTENFDEGTTQDIFKPIDKLEWMEIQTALEKQNITLDRVSADLMGRARKILQEELKLKLQELKT